MTTHMFNVRVEEELLELIERAAALARVRRSVWAREVMAVVASTGITMDELRRIAVERRPDGDGPVLSSPHPRRFLALQANEAQRAARNQVCSHPLTGVRQLPFTDVCGLCGVVVRRR